MRQVQALTETNLIGQAQTVPLGPAGHSALAVLEKLLESLQWPEGVHLEHFQLNGVWSGRRGRITVEYQLELDRRGARVCIPLQGVIAPRADRRLRARIRPKVKDHTLKNVLVGTTDGSCWLTSPDRDPEFPLVRQFSNSPRLALRIRDELAHTIGHNAHNLTSHDLHCKFVAYRTGRRFVVRLRAKHAQPGFFVKGFRRALNVRSFLEMNELADILESRSAGQFLAPRQAGCDPEAGWGAFHEIWPPPAKSGYEPLEIADAAELASTLHQLPPIGATMHAPEDELHTVARWETTLESIGIQTYSGFGRILQQLRTTAPALRDSECKLIHRDFYHAQILRNSKGIWITDWDTSCRGHPELDIATYVAHATLQASIRAHGEPKPAPFAEFLDCYHSSGGTTDSHRLEWYLTCALARLAAMHAARGFSDTALLPLWSWADQLARGVAQRTRI